MKKWILFGLSLLALTASLALSACGSQEQGSETGGGASTTTPETGAPAAPATGGEQGGTGGGATGGEQGGTGGGQ